MTWAGSVVIPIESAHFYQHIRPSETRLHEELAIPQREVAHHQRCEEIIGTGSAMAKVFALMESAILPPITVLLQGETGTGKELIARAIHDNGTIQAADSFVRLCGDWITESTRGLSVWSEHRL